jgi:hypothetical protein|eukprot:COSAG06_NODE_4878_length_3887_cov_3.049102_1_plen_65_part_00
MTHSYALAYDLQLDGLPVQVDPTYFLSKKCDCDQATTAKHAARAEVPRYAGWAELTKSTPIVLM